jgi:cell division protein FtsI (penicillin-binding protein 3)
VIGARLCSSSSFGQLSRQAERGRRRDPASRPDIFDRSGRLIATDVRAPSLFGEPRKIIDTDEAVEQLAAILPDLDTREMRERLSSKRGFVWLKREISPAQRAAIKARLPGIGFLTKAGASTPRGRRSRT